MKLRSPLPWLVLAVALLMALPYGDVSAHQVQTQQVRGVVRDFRTGTPLADVEIRVQGTDTFTHSDAQGRFILQGVPAGVWTLEVAHEGYGARTYAMDTEPGGFAEVEINLAGTEAAPGAMSAKDPPVAGKVDDPWRNVGHVAGADAIARSVGSVRNLGELVRQTIPALRSREVEAIAGVGLCLEFRRAAPRSGRALMPGGGEEELVCHHPRVFLDGVPAQDPTFVYGLTTLDDIRRIQAIPAAAAGARFGSAPNGVILVETRFMTTRPVPVDARIAGVVPPPGSPYVYPRRRSFDWSQDPEGHDFFRTFLGSIVGNAIGLAAGVAVGRECVFIEERTQDIEFSCGHAGVAGAGAAAVLLPAFGGALGARWGGRTQVSEGRLLPALVGAGMGILPGYIFSLSTVGDGVEAMNTVGHVMLLVGSPLLSTFADRLFRSLR